MEKKLNKIEGLISISRKAGFAIIGQDNLKGYAKKLYLLLVDVTAGKSLKREINFLAQKTNAQLFELENLGDLIGIENCKVVGLKNKAISENIIECLKGE